ncbi:MAG: S24/S26 family peptidase [Candidatus Limnocylindrales bacterium]
MVEATRDPQAIALIGLYRSYRDAGVEAWLETRGVSMRPLVGPGGRMLVEFGASPTRIGEIVVFERHGRIVAHRLVGSRRRGGREQLIVKGDAEAYFDPPIGRDDVLGVVRGVRRDALGPVRRWGLDGRSARLIAGVSRWTGRGARLAHRGAVLSPEPIRRTALRAIPALARVPTRLIMAPITQNTGAEGR